MTNDGREFHRDQQVRNKKSHQIGIIRKLKGGMVSVRVKGETYAQYWRYEDIENWPKIATDASHLEDDECSCAQCAGGAENRISGPIEESIGGEGFEGALAPPSIDFTQPLEALPHGDKYWVDVDYVGPYHAYHIVVDPQNEKIHRVWNDQLRNKHIPRTCEAWVNVFEDHGKLVFGAIVHSGEDAGELAEIALSHSKVRRFVECIKISYTEKREKDE